MPKLSQKTLEKRFSCSYCSRTFRTRQGLSGHIQFKHSTKKVPYEKSTTDSVIELTTYPMLLQAGGFSEAESRELTNIVSDWAKITALLPTQHLSIDKGDLKNFLIMAYATMYSNRRLKAEIVDDLRQAIANTTSSA